MEVQFEVSQPETSGAPVMLKQPNHGVTILVSPDVSQPLVSTGCVCVPLLNMCVMSVTEEVTQLVPLLVEIFVPAKAYRMLVTPVVLLRVTDVRLLQPCHMSVMVVIDKAGASKELMAVT